MSFSSSAWLLATLLSSAGPADPGSSAQPVARNTTFLGWAREIPRSRSASRDAPAFNLSLVPRDIRTASGEFALATFRLETVTLRTGFYGLIELEREGETQNFGDLFPQGTGRFFWRGSYGYSVAMSFDALARRLCARCGLEASAMFRHESEHFTDRNAGDGEADFSDRPLVGDELLLDAAARWATRDWILIGRVQNELFIPGRSSYSQGPGIDLYARRKLRGAVHVFFAGYAGYRFGTEFGQRVYPDAYLIRGQLGVALASGLGDLELFASGDVGHRMGLLVFTEERTLGLGVRLALGPAARD
jgi:hypothetical protein